MTDTDGNEQRAADARKAREAEAATAKAEAEAAKAKADAAKAEADAAKAAADARKAEQESADHDTAAATKAREAESLKKAAEADKDAAAARLSQLEALVPDLSSVKDSTLDVKDGPALWTSFLLGRAVNTAGQAVAEKVTGSELKTGRVLVTSDSDLATADAVYQDVTAGLEQLVTAAKGVLDRTRPEAMDEAVRTAAATPVGAALEAAGAIGGAIPAVLSLLSAQRTLDSAEVTASDLAAVAAVAGAMSQNGSLRVVHDNFRLTPSGGVYDRYDSVGTARQQLIARKITLGDRKSDIQAELASAQAEFETLKGSTPAPPNHAQQIEAAKRRIAGAQALLDEVENRAAVVDSVLTAIDAFMSTVRAIPAGARRSPLATAALHAELHGATPSFTHVLLVKTQAGQAQQMLDNQPLWLRDKFSTAVEIGITFILIETKSSEIVVAGTESSVKSARGKIGDSPTLDP